MGSSQVPAGVLDRRKCKCGRWFNSVCIGNTLKETEECEICRPELYSSKKEKK